MYRTYEHYSLEGLANLAETFRFQFADVNAPKSVQDFKAKVLPIHARFSMSASDGNVAMDYSSPMVRGLVMADISDVEDVLSQAWRRMEEENYYPLRLVDLFTNLDREVKRFLDADRGMALLDVRDFSWMSFEIERSFWSRARAQPG